MERQAVLGHEALPAGARELGEVALDRGHPGRVGLHGHQIGIREVPVVVRVLLRAHRGGDAPLRVPQARFLHDALAPLERADLPRGLVLEGVAHVPEGVHVLDLHLRPELGRAGPPDRHVGVAAERPRLHVPVADAEVPQDGPEASQVLGGLPRGPEVRPRDDLHERHARPVVVDQARARRFEHAALVRELADVLFQVEALDADPPGRAVDLDLQPAVLGQRRLVLADLVVLRHVGIEVVLPGEAARAVDPAVEGAGRADPELDRAAVDDRQHPGHALANRACLVVGRRAEGRGAAAEHLRAREELRVDLEPDDRLPGGAHAGDGLGAGTTSGRRRRTPRACS